MKTCFLCLVWLVFYLMIMPVLGRPPIDSFYLNKSVRSQILISSFDKDSLPFNLCLLMPDSEVAQLSPFPKPIKASKDIKEGIEGVMGCHYDFEWDRDGGYPQIDFSVEDYQTTEATRERLKDRVEVFKTDWGTDPVFISNLGDSAAFFGTDTIWCDICNLVVVSGRFWVELKFKGFSQNQITAKQKQESGVKLVSSLFQKKPLLKSKK